MTTMLTGAFLEIGSRSNINKTRLYGMAAPNAPNDHKSMMHENKAGQSCWP
jgi:hypothetical protein